MGERQLWPPSPDSFLVLLRHGAPQVCGLGGLASFPPGTISLTLTAMASGSGLAFSLCLL